MRLAILACLILALGAELADADIEPSFDCQKATTPIEALICDDPELIWLDGLVAQAYAWKLSGSDAKQTLKTEQRAWLASRFERCKVPKTGPALTRAQAWKPAPCLAALYAERVTALGGGAALQAERTTSDGAPFLAPSDPRLAAPGFVHPICIEIALGNDVIEGAPPPAPIPFAACNRGNRHRPVAITEAGFFTTANARGGYQGSFSYRIVGTLAGGRRLADAIFWGGGSGRLSYVVMLSGSASGELAVETVVPGGDRCFGGIDEVKVVGPDAIEVTSKLTAADFVRLGDAVPPERLTSDLESCAICCNATVRERHDLAKKTVTLVSTDVAGLRFPPENDVSKCFDDVIRPAAESESSLDAEQTKRLIADVIAKCGKIE